MKSDLIALARHATLWQSDGVMVLQTEVSSCVVLCHEFFALLASNTLKRKREVKTKMLMVIFFSYVVLRLPNFVVNY